MGSGKDTGAAKILGIPFVFLAALLFFAPAALAQSASSRISVSAVVLPVAAIRTVYQANSVEVTASDISRGYVEEPAATVVAMKSAKGGMVTFGGLSGPFTSFQVAGQTGAGPSAAVSPEGMYIPANIRTMSATSLDYRFYLAPEARPGDYSWPVPVEVSLE